MNEFAGAVTLVYAIQSWQRYQPVTNWHLYYDSANPFSDNGNLDWVDNGDEQNEAWFESQADTSSLCDGAAIGCTAYDHRMCFWFNTDCGLLGADTVIAYDAPYEITFQDTVAECFKHGGPYSVEGVALHELGHEIGLAHEESVMSVENTTRTGHHNCSALGWHEGPYPDDVQGYLSKQSNGVSSHNVRGTPWVRGDQASTFTSSVLAVTAWSSVVATVTFSLEGDTEPGGGLFMLLLIPDGQVPTKDANGTYSTEYGGSDTLLNYWTWSPGTPKTTTVTESVMIYGSRLRTTGLWRLWVITDPYKFQSEIDEDDNAFPTNVLVGRFP